MLTIIKSPGRPRGRSSTSQMICENAYRVDLRSLGAGRPHLLMPSGRLVPVEWTPGTFGGKRWWFSCPRCWTRCAVLYSWLCRRCFGGRYRSELASPHDRLLLRAIKIRKRLGQTTGGVIVPFPERPKFMHHRTYLRLKAECIELEQRFFGEEAERMRKMGMQV